MQFNCVQALKFNKDPEKRFRISKFVLSSSSAALALARSQGITLAAQMCDENGARMRPKKRKKNERKVVDVYFIILDNIRTFNAFFRSLCTLVRCAGRPRCFGLADIFSHFRLSRNAISFAHIHYSKALDCVSPFFFTLVLLLGFFSSSISAADRCPALARCHSFSLSVNANAHPVNVVPCIHTQPAPVTLRLVYISSGHR